MRGSRKFSQTGSNFDFLSFLADEGSQIPIKAGHHRPASETQMAFHWRADDTPTLNAGFVVL